jgi:predicted nucleic acid-binding protein
VIYLDTSVALAHLLAEDRVPPGDLWDQTLISSRLLEYELWSRIHARRLARSHGELVRQLLVRLALIELAAPVLGRALEPFPTPVRTLDALHLASIDFLRDRGQDVQLASYDERQIHAARAIGIETIDLDSGSPPWVDSR